MIQWRANLMEWTALILSLQLGAATLALLLPASVVLGRTLAVRRFPGKGLVEALVALPLVLPPTVLGFYLLVAFGARSPLGQLVRIDHRRVARLQLRGPAARVDPGEHPVRRAADSARVREHSRRRARSRGMLRHAPVARLAHHRAPARLARHRHRRDADVRAHARRIRRRADGRRQHPVAKRARSASPSTTACRPSTTAAPP